MMKVHCDFDGWAGIGGLRWAGNSRRVSLDTLFQGAFVPGTPMRITFSIHLRLASSGDVF
jgi:hypothetical protein